jgi:hypothetical protein
MEDFDYIKFLEEENRYAHSILKKLEDENRNIKNLIKIKIFENFSLFKDDGNGLERIFKIDVGSLPKGKAEEIIERYIKRYRYIGKSADWGNSWIS